MTGSLILGRSPNLVLGFLVALYNVVAIAHLGGFAPTPELTAAVNILLGAAVALIANTASIQVAAGDAAKARRTP